MVAILATIYLVAASPSLSPEATQPVPYQKEPTQQNASPNPSVEEQQDTSKATRIHPDQLVWKDALPPLTAGAKVTVLEGSPKAEGIFTLRLKLPPHWLLDQVMDHIEQLRDALHLVYHYRFPLG